MLRQRESFGSPSSNQWANHLPPSSDPSSSITVTYPPRTVVIVNEPMVSEPLTPAHDLFNKCEETSYDCKFQDLRARLVLMVLGISIALGAIGFLIAWIISGYMIGTEYN
jgi:hypothetical protein